ncbi:MAG: hypothetical protein AB8G22_26945 [Saprospiraceae bacterium]
MSHSNLKLADIIAQEDEQLRQRRAALHGENAADELEETRFGIALSGGGIRSATINLGILRTLNKFGILKHVDYLSSVSGGGYTNSYVQATLKNTGSYDELFTETHLNYMRSRGIYLFPGTGLVKLWNQFILIIGYLISLVMSWVSPLILLLMGFGAYWFSIELINTDRGLIENGWEVVYYYGGMALIFFFVLHYFSNILLNFDLNASALFNRFETLTIGVCLFAFALIALLSFEGFNQPDWDKLFPAALISILLVVLGFFTNPNATSFHRFYRKQLADTFLHFTDYYRNVPLHELFQPKSEKLSDKLAPYPLINTCLNLQAVNDENFKGTKTNDYFLLSPLYCGSKLTGYVSTKENSGYRNMTLPAATTISAAAVNPGMGIYSNRISSILTTIFNARLGYWVFNPLKAGKTQPVVFWPFYFIYELLGMFGTDNRMVNISDGAHIENLGVYELLRRKCKLIIGVDSGADPLFAFSDLERLTIRARNELGIDIRFRPGQDPEDVIRPKPSHGYSRQRYAVADLYQIWDKVEKEIDGEKCEVIEHYENKKIGTFIYVKSSVMAPEGRPKISSDDWLKYGTYKYKIYHPAFPHEPTSDQFFDPIQWESYYQLGQHIGSDILGIDDFVGYQDGTKTPFEITGAQLIEHFDHELNLFSTPLSTMDELEKFMPISQEEEEAYLEELELADLQAETFEAERDFVAAQQATEVEEDKVVNKEVKYKM